MELFAIHCTTCKARLVVKDESVIGDILSCPKCSSMVQVVPPVGWKRPGSGDTSPGELAAVSPAASQPSAPVSETPAGQPPSGESPAKTVAAAVPPALPPRAAAQPATTVNPSTPPAAAAAAPSEVAAAPATPAATEAAPTLFSAAVAWAKRDWIVLASGLAGGVVLGAAVWLVVAMQTTAPVVVADRAAANAPSADAASAEQASQPTAAAPASKSPQPSNVAVPADAPREDPHVVADLTGPAESGELESATGAAPEDVKPQAERPATAETVEDAAPQKRGPSLKLEPIRPSGTPLDRSAAVPSAATTPRELVPLEAEPADEAAESPVAKSLGKPGPLSREQIDERLAVSLASVEFADVPLAQFAAFIADVSGVPVALDEGALSKAGQGRRSPINLKLTQTTAGEALRTAVKRAGLSVAIQDGRIVVTRAGE